MLPAKNVGRVCYPPKAAGKMPALQDSTLRNTGMLPTKNGRPCMLTAKIVGRVCYPPKAAGTMPALRDQIQLAPASDSLDAAVGVEFDVDILGMHANGIYTHHQFAGDIIGSERAGQQP